ncbi:MULTISPECIES: ABC transporter ATP-binding protein [Lacrimispora]|uniref:ABC transporter ATP-binding protein n=1 Tax=Lacrimispora TaxID=2719231 RepID=UPI000BE26249|nr:ABC transporter ATP-binding protein [Lacrimispora amygdalina]MDK2968162.1 type transport system ATP-binding protein [Lacrimispora sp.]
MRDTTPLVMKEKNNQHTICVTDVCKSFGTKSVLNGVNFTIHAGEITALLGHNGAGKTTLLRIILGLVDIDNGEVSVFGENPLSSGERIRKDCGVLCEDTGLYESLTVYDNLKFFAEIYGCPKQEYEEQIDILLERFDILETKYQIIKNFSMGMKKKVAIIRTILHNPKIVLLDEPVNSLDPVSILTLHDIIEEMREKYNTTFLITTHNLEEVKKICDKIIIMKKGKNVVEQSLSLDSYLKTKIDLVGDIDVQSVKTIMDQHHLTYALNDHQLITPETDKIVISEIIKELVYNKTGICGVTREQFDLNKLYLETEEAEHE